MIEYFLNNDYKGIIMEYIIHSGLDIGIKKLRDRKIKSDLNKEKKIIEQNIKEFIVDFPEESIETNVANSIIRTYNWSKDIRFRDMDERKSLLSIYIELEFYLAIRRFQLTNQNYPNRASLEYVFRDSDINYIIVGDPGAGKTTLLKSICQKMLLKDTQYFKNLNYPILVRFRDLNNFDCTNSYLILFDYIISIFGLSFASKVKEKKNFNGNEVQILKRYIAEFLEDLEILILFDGFDEINDTKIRRVVIEDLEFLSNTFYKSKLIVTSRSADFKYTISNSSIYEICELRESQIIEFTDKWLNDSTSAEKLRNELKQLPYFDTSKRPLTLAHLCAIYERYNSLPPKPKSIYKKVVMLYLEEWDIQRRIYRKRIGEDATEYSKIDNERKLEFLSKFAFILTVKFKKFVFSEKDMGACFELLSEEFSLPKTEEKKIITEIESHNGLLIQTSASQFEFSHKSIQEYLTADYIVRLGTFPNDKKILLQIPNELAICLSLSSNPNNYFASLILYSLRDHLTMNSFIHPFLHRLIAEKPDFYVDPVLGLTILSIYSLSKFNTLLLMENSIQNTRDSDNETLKYLFTLIESSVIIRKSIKIFVEDFTKRISTAIFSKNIKYEFGIYLLERIEILPGFKTALQPKHLAINEEILYLMNKNGA
jgi:hypothetical protein